VATPFSGNSTSIDDQECKTASVLKPLKQKGRQVAEIWRYFTDETEPQKKASSKCKHRLQSVAYSKKSKRVETHLLKCRASVEMMMEIEFDSRSEWFRQWFESKRAKAETLSSARTSQSQALSIRNYLLPKITKKGLAKIEEYIAMHYYLTRTSFVRIEESNLLKAFKICRTDAELPDRMKLAGFLLDRCYKKVKGITDDRLQRVHFYCCLTSDAWSNIKNESIINYMLVGGKLFLFLESVATGEASHTAQYIADDISRVIGELKTHNVQICGVVTDNTNVNQAVWKILQAFYLL